jgi:hypothetical protein
LNRSFFCKTKPIFLNFCSSLDFCIDRSNRRGDERMWWKGINIDPLRMALKLWKQGRIEGTALVPKTTTQTSQLGLAADRIGVPKAASTAPANGGSSE